MSTSTTVPQRASRAQRQSNAIARAESLTVDYYLDGDKMIVASATTPGRALQRVGLLEDAGSGAVRVNQAEISRLRDLARSLTSYDGPRWLAAVIPRLSGWILAHGVG